MTFFIKNKEISLILTNRDSEKVKELNKINKHKNYNKDKNIKLRLSYDIDYLSKKELSRVEILDYIDKIDDNLVKLILVSLFKLKKLYKYNIWNYINTTF